MEYLLRDAFRCVVDRTFDIQPLVLYLCFCNGSDGALRVLIMDNRVLHEVRELLADAVDLDYFIFEIRLFEMGESADTTI